jgi:hypothetical protein
LVIKSYDNILKYPDIGLSINVCSLLRIIDVATPAKGYTLELKEENKCRSTAVSAGNHPSEMSVIAQLKLVADPL